MSEDRRIPQSTALSDVRGESLQELFSRDPESYSQQSLQAIISHMRQIGEKLASTENIRQVRVVRPGTPRSTGYDDVGF